MGNSTPLQAIRSVARAGRPVLCVSAAEEDRVLAALEELSAELGGPLTAWSCLDTERELWTAIAAAIQTEGPGVFAFKDPGPFLERPEALRALRDAYYALRDEQGKLLVLVGPDLRVPAGLELEVAQVEVGPPGEDELRACIDALDAESPGVLPAFEHLLGALRGLNLADVRHTLRGALAAGASGRDEVLAHVFAEKQRLVRRAGVLEFVPPRFDLGHLGGLQNLKAWLQKRAGLFSRAALEQGLPVPRGILLMGVSGCGKSFAIKTTSALWQVPLFRLDMNLVFSGLYGNPEAAFDRALRTVETVSPAVLWIDEIENGLSFAADGNSQSHLFSAFLTWMQEKPPLVFVAATANRIELLPAEVLRKGRFDEVFFCDLPTKTERREIVKVHLQLAGQDPDAFNVDYLVMDTEGWTGAEIEQAIAEARVDAAAEGRPLETVDITRVADRSVPLSRTMHEQIRALREWTHGRATRASKPPSDR